MAPIFSSPKAPSSPLCFSNIAVMRLRSLSSNDAFIAVHSSFEDSVVLDCAAQGNPTNTTTTTSSVPLNKDSRSAEFTSTLPLTLDRPKLKHTPPFKPLSVLESFLNTRICYSGQVDG